jgi:hypothetical protein
MSRRVTGIRRERLENITVSQITSIFEELEGYWQNIEGVLRDMLPSLPEQ